MILSEVRDYLRGRQRASLQDLARHFDTDPDALRGMLEFWVQRGQVFRQNATPSCGSQCGQCDPSAVEIYSWGPPAAPNLGIPVLVEGRCPG